MNDNNFQLSEKITKNREKPEKMKNSQDEIIISKYENKREKKEIRILYSKSRHSSDLTSNSYTPTDALSQTSEFIPNDQKQNKKINILHENIFNYFNGIENHFKKTEPHKFIEYKYSKNFLKKSADEIIDYCDYEVSDMNIPYQNQMSKNVIDMNNYYAEAINNYYNNIFNGNIIYYIYNNYYINYPYSKSASEIVINNKFTKKTENKEIETKEKYQIKKDEEKKEEEEKTKNDNGIEIIKSKKEEIIEDKNERTHYNKKYSKKKFHREYNKKDDEIDNCEQKEFKNKDYHEHRKKDDSFYYNSIPLKTYSNNYKRKHIYYEYNNKFNGYWDKRKKYFYGEKNIYKKKYY